MMRARDNFITLQRAIRTEDAYGEPVETWQAIGQEWAAIYYGRGDERRNAAMEQGEQPASFEMLSNTKTRSLTLRDRIIADGLVWDIRGIARDTPKRGYIAITAVADQDIAP